MERGSAFAAGFAAAWLVMIVIALIAPPDNWISPAAAKAGWGQRNGQLYIVTPADAAPQVRP